MKEKEKYLSLISKHFPELKWKKSILLKDNGLDYAIIILDEKTVFRFPKKESSATPLKVEVNVLKNLKSESKIKIPNYKYVAPNCIFAGYRLIQGDEVNLGELNKKLLSKSNSNQLSLFLSCLHNYNKTTAKRQGVKGYWGYGLIEKEARRKLKFISKLLTKDELKFLNQKTKKIKTLKFKTSCLIHGDLTHRHLLARKNKFSGIIDFGDMGLGDPSIDFLLFWDFGEDFIQKVYEKYSGPKDSVFLHRAELANLYSHISNTYYGLKLKRKTWLNYSLKRLKKICKEGLKTEK